ncbi:hypothetical protein [Streptomyces sp. NBC_00696]|uniref:hypothetical protein n=1 Tax=Streptomyces sp. NBC_00696 TaxID=2903672 RepID=UPI002E30314A|nr:hypothetical protein [Streptomyces sp. NBC_00696]
MGPAASLAAVGRTDDAEHALTTALNELDSADGEAPGRFGFDSAELALDQAEAYLALGRAADARARAEASLSGCISGTPGWAAASLVLAQGEVPDAPQDAVQRAHDVPEHVPPARLRSAPLRGPGSQSWRLPSQTRAAMPRATSLSASRRCLRRSTPTGRN